MLISSAEPCAPAACDDFSCSRSRLGMSDPRCSPSSALWPTVSPVGGNSHQGNGTRALRLHSSNKSRNRGRGKGVGSQEIRGLALLARFRACCRGTCALRRLCMRCRGYFRCRGCVPLRLLRKSFLISIYSAAIVVWRGKVESWREFAAGEALRCVPILEKMVWEF